MPRRYAVHVIRIAYQRRHDPIIVEANNRKEAAEIAHAQAGCHEYREYNADYEVETVEIIKEES